MATPNVSEIVTTTLRNRSGKLADAISANNALLWRMKKKGKVKPITGGRVITQEIMYAQNNTVKRYAGYDLLNVQPQDVMTAAEYDIKQVAVAVSISGLEQLQNNGEEAMIDLLEQRIENAETSIMNTIGTDLYSDGSADGGKQIGGLQLLVSTAPSSGVVGGINRANWQFWRNAKFSGVADGGAAVTKDNIQSYMNRLYLNTLRGKDHVDLIPADNTYYRYYLESLQAIQRITSDEMASAGFDNLKYMGADVVCDGGYGGGSPVNSMFFLNTNYLFFRPHADRNFTQIGGERVNPNQDAMVKLIGWAGNMTMNNAFLQGVLIA